MTLSFWVRVLACRGVASAWHQTCPSLMPYIPPLFSGLPALGCVSFLERARRPRVEQRASSLALFAEALSSDTLSEEGGRRSNVTIYAVIRGEGGALSNPPGSLAKVPLVGVLHARKRRHLRFRVISELFFSVHIMHLLVHQGPVLRSNTASAHATRDDFGRPERRNLIPMGPGGGLRGTTTPVGHDNLGLSFTAHFYSTSRTQVEEPLSSYGVVFANAVNEGMTSASPSRSVTSDTPTKKPR